MARCRHTNAKVALAWGLVWWCLSQAGLAAVLIWARPELRDPLVGAKLVQLRRQMTNAEPGAARLVMLGSSRTFNGFEPQALADEAQRMGRARPVVYNLGVPGAGPLTELVYLKRMLAAGLKPDVVLVEVLPRFLVDAHGAHDQFKLSAPTLFLSETSLVERYTGQSGLSSEWWRGWLAPCLTYRYALLRQISDRLLPPDILASYAARFDASGWNVLDRQSVTPQRRERALNHARTEYSSVLKAPCRQGPSCRALEELLSICEEHGVRARLVLMPEGADFRSWYSAGAVEDLERFLNDLATRYDAPLIDAREWVPDDDFLDSHHLLAEGATLFSQRLGQRLGQSVGPLEQTAVRDLRAPR